VDDEEDGNANKRELEAFLETLFGSSKNRMSKKAIDKALMHILLMVAVSLMKEEERRVFVKRVLDTTIKSSTGTGVSETISWLLENIDVDMRSRIFKEPF
jgi:hypothetical protein